MQAAGASAPVFCCRQRCAFNKNARAAYTVKVKYLMFTGGGSAGHVTPNLAVMQILQNRYRLAYMGTQGIERTLVGAFGCPYFTVECPKLIRAFTPKNLALPFALREAQKKALAVMEREKPDLVFSKGGYASYPAVWAASKLHIPVLTHESDLSPGLCTRIVAKRCRRVLTSFPETAARFPNGVCVGSPMRRELFGGDRQTARRRYGFTGDAPVLLVLGGGSGSRALNEAVETHLPALLRRFCILQLCGKGNVTPAPKGCVRLEYETDMGSAYACADLVLSRAGSNTLFELRALKKPALVVPLARRTRGDQAKNAAYFARKGWCDVLPERRLGELPAALLRLYGSATVRAALAADRAENGTQNILGEIQAAIAYRPK